MKRRVFRRRLKTISETAEVICYGRVPYLGSSVEEVDGRVWQTFSDKSGTTEGRRATTGLATLSTMCDQEIFATEDKDRRLQGDFLVVHCGDLLEVRRSMERAVVSLLSYPRFLMSVFCTLLLFG